MKYKLEIKPAISPEKRHKIEDVLRAMGYVIIGGGTDLGRQPYRRLIDVSVCDISFEDKGMMPEKFFIGKKEYPSLLAAQAALVPRDGSNIITTVSDSHCQECSEKYGKAKG